MGGGHPQLRVLFWLCFLILLLLKSKHRPSEVQRCYCILIFPKVSLVLLGTERQGSFPLSTPTQPPSLPFSPLWMEAAGGSGSGWTRWAGGCQGLSVPYLSTNPNYCPRISMERTGKCGEIELIILNTCCLIRIVCFHEKLWTSRGPWEGLVR